MKRTPALAFATLLATLLCFALPMEAATTWYVNSATGHDTNNCTAPSTPCVTISHAISRAVSGDTIQVAPGTYPEHITIAANLHLLGSGPGTTILGRGAHGFSGPVVFVKGGTVLISKFTIRDGNSVAGAGIANYGVLTLVNSLVTGNHARNVGAVPGRGGGIYNRGTMVIDSTTISNNVALSYSGNGGGIYNVGRLALNNSTISKNEATTDAPFGPGGSSDGGGIYNAGQLSINSSTIASNTAYGGRGGGIYNSYSSITIQNTILANNTYTGAENCYGVLTSLGYNLTSDQSCTLRSTGDLSSTDPKLGPLQNNGGWTPTEALVPGSPAIDAGNPAGCRDSSGNLLKTDQRGYPRHDKEDSAGCDIGAYESQTD